jgi:hypothetical protein
MANPWDNDPIATPTTATSSADTPWQQDAIATAAPKKDVKPSSDKFASIDNLAAEQKQKMEEFSASRKPTGFSPTKLVKAGAEGAGVGMGLGVVAAPFTGGASLLATPELAIGGGISGVLGELSDQLGLSARTKLLAEIGGGSSATAVKALTERLITQGVKTAAGIFEGNIPKAWQSFKGIGTETEAEVAKRSAAIQKESIGPATEGYVSGQPSGTNAIKAQEDLRNIAKDQYNMEVPADKTVSSTLREQMYKGVGDIVEKNYAASKAGEAFGSVGGAAPKSNLFSKSPEFNDLQKQLGTLKEKGTISSEDYNDLVKRLKTDTSSNMGTRKSYGDTVDTLIREWQGTVGAEGKASLPANIQNNVREKLRTAFSQWTDSQGLGKIEKGYRDAYRAEKIASAKDAIPEIISKYTGKQAELNKVVEQLGTSLPEAKPLFLNETQKYLANIPASQVASEYARIEQMLVNAKVLSPYEAKALGEKAAMVGKVAAGGTEKTAADRAKRVILNGLKSAVSGMAGSAMDKTVQQ